MSVTSNRSIVVSFSQDIEYSQEFDASPNPAGSGEIMNAALNVGDNIIVVPYLATGFTFVPPPNNLISFTLKGVAGDTGIKLSLTDPSSFGITGMAQFIINASGSVVTRFLFT